MIRSVSSVVLCSVFSWRFFSPWILASLTSILVWIKDGCGSSSLQKMIAGGMEELGRGLEGKNDTSCLDTRKYCMPCMQCYTCSGTAAIPTKTLEGL